VQWGDFFKGDLPGKFGALLVLLAVSRVGVYVPLWGVDRELFQAQLGEGSLLATLDTLSGGGIGRLGLFSLGIVPYINAQIVFQLLGVLYPKIQEMQKKEGEAGRGRRSATPSSSPLASPCSRSVLAPLPPTPSVLQQPQHTLAVPPQCWRT